ncbi:MAG: alkene reductase [Alphaproteobacteria bacterium]|nr:alkene reductase [Alphaproteobacteria bacterium]
MSATLFDPVHFGAIACRNRVVMAPLTRGRASPAAVPTELMRDYYEQRASAGLIIAEATAISEQGYGWYHAPGIWNDAQRAAWKTITDAVHAASGKIVLQLWHMGRVSHPDFHADGSLPVAPSAVGLTGEVRTPAGKKPFVAPRALETDEIPDIVQDYVAAARRARDAGFDGVEIHASNGYLLDEFLRDGANKRTDSYGGSVENRARFLLETTQAVAEEIGADRTGVRISPTNPKNDMNDSDPASLFSYLAGALDPIGLAYLHVMEPLPGHMLADPEGRRITPLIRERFSGPLIVNGGYDAAKGTDTLATGQADAVSYGVLYIANPDLVHRFQAKAPLNKPEPDSFYSEGPKGYTDYPAMLY